MSLTAESREHRRKQRRNWAVRVVPLDEEPHDDLLKTTSAAERVAMVWTITRDAWSLAGQPIPEYSRAEIPIRILRP